MQITRLSYDKILIIEDDLAMAETLAEYLRPEGHEVAVAHSGADGLSALNDRPDCVLLDLNLPDMHGFDVLETITDEGSGFDWKTYMEIDPARALDNNGRDIAQANQISFDELIFNEKGNEVTAISRSGSGIQW